jgi:hypothetical protein
MAEDERSKQIMVRKTTFFMINLSLLVMKKLGFFERLFLMGLALTIGRLERQPAVTRQG